MAAPAIPGIGRAKVLREFAAVGRSWVSVPGHIGLVRGIAFRGMPDSSKPKATQRKPAPTYKEKGAVQRSVTALLDELAPERSLTRAERVPEAVEAHRSPNGCVLQGPGYAVSVSWFGDESKGATLGELHIMVWSGTVARRGATRHTKGAKLVSELTLKPIEPPEGGNIWRTLEGEEYSTESLVAKCVALLEEQALQA